MTKSLTIDDFRAALPDLTGTLQLPRLEDRGEIYRDTLDILHIRTQSLHDAFFAQGFVHTQERLWQMDYDRHPTYGRWAQ